MRKEKLIEFKMYYVNCSVLFCYFLRWYDVPVGDANNVQNSLYYECNLSDQNLLDLNNSQIHCSH